MKNRAFSLAETLIALAIVAVVAVILIPAIKHFMPDQNQVLASKAYNILESGIKNIVEDSSYNNPSQDQGKDMDHMSSVGKTEDTLSYVSKGLANLSTSGTSVPSGQDKFCYILSRQMSALTTSCTPDSNNTTSFKTSNGMSWEIHEPTDAFKLRNDIDAYKTRIVFDIDGTSKGSNCGTGTYIAACTGNQKADRYEVGVRYDGKIMTAADLNTTGSSTGMPDIVNTCGKHGTLGPLLLSDWKYHLVDAIVKPYVPCDAGYDCVTGCNTTPGAGCGVTNEGHVSPTDPTVWILMSDAKTGAACSGGYCNICNTASPSCGMTASAEGGYWAVRDNIATNADGTHKTCGTSCKICSTDAGACGMTSALESGKWVTRDAKANVGGVYVKCDAYSHDLCSSGSAVSVPAGQNKQGAIWVTTWDKDYHTGIGNGYCSYCYTCSNNSPSCGMTTTAGVTKDNASGEVCTTVCTACSADTSNGGCGTHIDAGCTTTMPSCDVYDNHTTSQKCPPAVCNSNYVCGSSAGQTTTLNTTTWKWETKDNNTSDACVATLFPGNSCPPPVDCKSCDATIGCGTHYSCDPTSHICNTYDNKNTTQACGTDTCDTGYTMANGKCTAGGTQTCTPCSNGTGGCGTTATCDNGTCNASSRTYTETDKVTTTQVCKSYTNLCPTSIDNAAIIAYLQTLSKANSAAMQNFDGVHHPGIGDSHSDGQFSYSMVTATPSTYDTVFTYYDDGPTVSDNGTFFAFLNSLSSDMAPALASQANNGLTADQIKATMNSTLITMSVVQSFGLNGCTFDSNFYPTGGCSGLNDREYSYKCPDRSYGDSWVGGQAKFCRGNRDQSLSVDPSIVVQLLLSSFYTNCQNSSLNPIFTNRCSIGTHQVCPSLSTGQCIANCQMVDNIYGTYCSAGAANPNYLGKDCCSNPCCNPYTPSYTRWKLNCDMID